MDHHKLYIKCGDTRTASRDPTTHTRGPTPPNLGATNNTNHNGQLGFMTQYAEPSAATAASAEHRSRTPVQAQFSTTAVQPYNGIQSAVYQYRICTI